MALQATAAPTGTRSTAQSYSRPNMLKSCGPSSAYARRVPSRRQFHTHAKEYSIMKARLGRTVLTVKSKERATRPAVTAGPPIISL
jgi:hypothetical protein